MLSEFCHSSHIWQTARGHFITRLKKLLACHYEYNPGKAPAAPDGRTASESPGGVDRRGSAPQIPGHTERLSRGPGPCPLIGQHPEYRPLIGPQCPRCHLETRRPRLGSVCLKLPAMAEGAGGRLRARDMSGIRWESNKIHFISKAKIWENLFPLQTWGEEDW